MDFIRQTTLVFQRSLRHSRRNPTFAFVFPWLVPLLLLWLFSQMFQSIAQVPGFPAGNYVSWVAPGVFLMTAMFGAQYSAQAFVSDVESGYLDRLRLLPVHPGALMFGRLLFDVARVAVGGGLVLLVSIALGAHWHGGPLAALALLALLALWTLTYGGVFYLVGLRARSAEAIQGLIPLFMPVAMLSNAFVPRGLLPRWIQWATRANPYSYVLDGVRMFATRDFAVEGFALAVGVMLVVLALVYTGAARAFASLVRAD